MFNKVTFNEAIRNQVEGYCEACRVANELQLQCTEETLKSMVISAFIQESKGGIQTKTQSHAPATSRGGSNYSGGGGSYNKPAGQIMQVGVPCLACNQPLKQSKKGNPYCSCWFND